MVVITYIMDFVSQGKKVKTKRNLTHLSLIYKRTLKYDRRNFLYINHWAYFFWYLQNHNSSIWHSIQTTPPPKKNSQEIESKPAPLSFSNGDNFSDLGTSFFCPMILLMDSPCLSSLRQKNFTDMDRQKIVKKKSYPGASRKSQCDCQGSCERMRNDRASEKELTLDTEVMRSKLSEKVEKEHMLKYEDDRLLGGGKGKEWDLFWSKECNQAQTLNFSSAKTPSNF